MVIANSAHPVTLRPLCSRNHQLAVALVVLVRLLAGAQSAGAGTLECAIAQVTNGMPPPVVHQASISGTGTRIIFKSRLQGAGILDVTLFDLPTGVFTPLITGEPSFPGTPLFVFNDAGTRTVATASSDLTGENPDGNEEIVLLDVMTNAATQITKTVGPPNSGATMSGDGSTVAFSSSHDLTGRNADRSQEIFLLDVRTGVLTQITNANGSSAVEAELDGDGSHLAFTSRADITGENPDGNDEVFLFDVTGGLFTQITRTVGVDHLPGVQPPSLNRAGTHLAFRSAGNLTGRNPDGSLEVFVFDMRTGDLTQITPMGSHNSHSPSLNADATRLVFVSDADLTDGNPEHHDEVFLADLTSGTFTQITRRPSSSPSFPSSPPQTSAGQALSSSGTRVVFTATHDYTGDNPELALQVFLATCGLVNEWVTLDAQPDTFRVLDETAGCPVGSVATFAFTARLTATADSPALNALRLQVQDLTNGNLLRDANGGGGIAAALDVPRTGGYADAVLERGEAVDVPLAVCLVNREPFQFLVDVAGGRQ